MVHRGVQIAFLVFLAMDVTWAGPMAAVQTAAVRQRMPVMLQTAERADQTICPLGSGMNTLNSSCGTCPVGKYGPDGLRCLPCMTGYSSSTEGAATPEDCNVCAKGYYMANSRCAQCPDGMWTPSIGSTDVSACTECAPGGNRDRNGFCRACGYGTYDNSTACVPCAKGSYAHDGVTECTLCAVNTYSDMIGASECKACGSRLRQVAQGSDHCDDSDDVPSWFLKVFQTLLIFMSLSALYTNAGLRMKKITAFVYMLIFCALTVAVFVGGLYPVNSNVIPSMRVHVFIVTALIVFGTVAAYFLRMFFARAGSFIGEVNFIHVLLTVFCGALVCFTEYRLTQGVGPVRKWDVPLLLAIYTAMQAQVTFIFKGLSRVGITASYQAIVFLMTCYVAIVALPIVVVIEGITATAEEWETADYDNVYLVNAIFGLFSTGVMFVLRILATMKASTTSDLENAKQVLKQVVKLERAAGELRCAESPKANDWPAIAARQTLTSALSTFGDKKCEACSGPLVCTWVRGVDQALQGDLSIIAYMVGKQRIVGVQSPSNPSKMVEEGLLQRCSHLPKKILADLDVARDGAKRWRCKDMKTAMVEFHSVLSREIAGYKNLTATSAHVTSWLADGVSDTITSQLLIATGFYGAVASLAKFANTMRDNFEGEHLRLYLYIGLFLFSGLAMMLTWLAVSYYKASQGAHTDKLAEMRSKYDSDCQPKDCGQGMYFNFDCEGAKDGCVMCDPARCPTGEYHEPSQCTGSSSGCMVCRHDVCTDTQIYDPTKCGLASNGCEDCPEWHVSINDHTKCMLWKDQMPLKSGSAKRRISV